MRYYQYFKLDSEPKDAAKVVYMVRSAVNDCNYILGIYSTKEKAEAAIEEDDCSWREYSQRSQD